VGNKPIYIVVPGNPIAKKRPRFARVGKGVKTYNPSQEDEASFLSIVKGQFDKAREISGPIHLDLTFLMQRPKSHYGTGGNENKLKVSAPIYHTTTPDCDNLTKLVMDALNGYMWKDDAQVTMVNVWKKYHEKIDQFGPRTLIHIHKVGLI
jgi:Holliday junction resolvase RusA-like endonuclease